MPYSNPVYSSANPAVDALFGREFSAWQAEDKGRQADEVNKVARAQIAAQSQLAQAQMRDAQAQREYSNLFRMQELTSRDKAEAERNRIFGRQIDVQEKGLTAGRDATAEAAEKATKEANRLAIATANAEAKATAQRWQSVFETKLADALEATRKAKAGYWLTTEKGAAKEMADPNDPERKAAEAKAWSDTLRELQLNKTDAPFIIPKFNSKTFDPAIFDESGNLMNNPFVAPAGTQDEWDEWGRPKIKPDLGTAAGLGTTPAVVTPVVTANPAALGPEAQAVVGVGQPLVNKVLGSAAEMFGVKAPVAYAAPVVAPAAKIQVPIDEASALEMSGEDAAEAARQLRSVPPEQVPAVAAAIRDGLIKSGRARIVVRLPPMHEVLKQTSFN